MSRVQNLFDPGLRDPNGLCQIISNNAAGCKVDPAGILSSLSTWVGRYRNETRAPLDLSPREQHAHADEMADLIAKLERLWDGMPPGLRVHIKDGLRQLREREPNFARLRASVIAAKEQLRTPRNGEQPHIARRDEVIRQVATSIKEHAPEMPLAAVHRCAAELVGHALNLRVPTDAKELRKIVRG